MQADITHPDGSLTLPQTGLNEPPPLGVGGSGAVKLPALAARPLFRLPRAPALRAEPKQREPPLQRLPTRDAPATLPTLEGAGDAEAPPALADATVAVAGADIETALSVGEDAERNGASGSSLSSKNRNLRGLALVEPGPSKSTTATRPSASIFDAAISPRAPLRPMFLRNPTTVTLSPGTGMR
eukprot:TRINITY_DN11239_c0_g2_i5.p2 TRINITY_DN11239_c0_g2~~TRINITY_DN11239_c0_g2_i5.p2  ORF type:complete len:184 (-),score=16.75 TRINITY_DN11239_c0_g2_i5:1729-2280(-)